MVTQVLSQTEDAQRFSTLKAVKNKPLWDTKCCAYVASHINCRFAKVFYKKTNTTLITLTPYESKLLNPFTVAKGVDVVWGCFRKK